MICLSNLSGAFERKFNSVRHSECNVDRSGCGMMAKIFPSGLDMAAMLSGEPFGVIGNSPVI